jgi:hypothetical protein
MGEVFGEVEVSCHIIEGARVVQLIMAGSKSSVAAGSHTDVLGRCQPPRTKRTNIIPPTTVTTPRKRQ